MIGVVVVSGLSLLVSAKYLIAAQPLRDTGGVDFNNLSTMFIDSDA